MKRYNGKNAWWFILVVVVYNLLPVLIFLDVGKSDILSEWWILCWGIYYSCDLVFIPVIIRNRVDLFDEYFIFYYGFRNEKINIKDIIKIEKGNNPTASSANSLDRINIVTKEKDFYISLKNNNDFINEIKSIIK